MSASTSDNRHRVGAQKKHACRHCGRCFVRREHLARHERTHTKEKPYSCAACGQCFTRSDLLVRHNRLSHQQNPQPPADARTLDSSSRSDDAAPQTQAGAVEDQNLVMVGPGAQTLHADLDLLHQPINMNPQMRPNELFVPSLFADDMVHDGLHHLTDGAANQAQGFGLGSLDVDTAQINPFEWPLDEDAFFRHPADVWCTNVVLPAANLPSYLAPQQPVPFFWPDTYDSSLDLQPENITLWEPSVRHAQAAAPRSFIDSPNAADAGLEDETYPSSTPLLFSDVSSAGRASILQRLQAFTHVLPADFALPSRLALSRYLSAFFGGFHDHMPFLHAPTMSIDRCPVELLIAIAAAGAFYRFEHSAGEALFRAGDSIVTEMLRQSDDAEMEQLGQSMREQYAEETLQFSAHSAADPVVSLEMMQAILLLMAIGTWSEHDLFLRKAIGLQSKLSIMVRCHGLNAQSWPPETSSWKSWARDESAKRTKLIAFCFFNLQGLIYDIASPIAPIDIYLDLPCTMSLFEASTKQCWLDALIQIPQKGRPFQSSFSELFSEDSVPTLSANSSLGNYVLVHALLQQIFLAKQLDRYQSKPREASSNHTALDSLERALRKWQRHWQLNQDSSLDITGSIPFNSIAILRLAYIRLNVDFGPCRALQSRRPSEVACVLSEQNPKSGLQRPRLLRAIIHAVHTLSVPIKIGVTFVARTHAVFWSVQHCLCSLECAILLATWLHDLAVQEDPLKSLDTTGRSIIKMVNVLLAETEFSARQDRVNDQSEAQKLRSMAAAVVRVWAKTFTSPQTWPILEIMGKSLQLYANILENETPR